MAKHRKYMDYSEAQIQRARTVSKKLRRQAFMQDLNIPVVSQAHAELLGYDPRTPVVPSNRAFYSRKDITSVGSLAPSVETVTYKRPYGYRLKQLNSRKMRAGKALKATGNTLNNPLHYPLPDEVVRVNVGYNLKRLPAPTPSPEGGALAIRRSGSLVSNTSSSTPNVGTGPSGGTTSSGPQRVEATRFSPDNPRETVYMNDAGETVYSMRSKGKKYAAKGRQPQGYNTPKSNKVNTWRSTDFVDDAASGMRREARSYVPPKAYTKGAYTYVDEAGAVASSPFKPTTALATREGVPTAAKAVEKASSLNTVFGPIVLAMMANEAINDIGGVAKAGYDYRTQKGLLDKAKGALSPDDYYYQSMEPVRQAQQDTAMAAFANSLSGGIAGPRSVRGEVRL